MKIRRITATSTRAAPEQCSIAIECEGITGIAVAPAAVGALAPRIADALLKNEDPRAIATHWRRLCAANDTAQGALGPTIAALDCALWDLRAKLNDEPLWRTLGGLRPRVNVHARLGLDISDASVSACARNLAARQTRGVILTSTLDFARDIARLADARDTLGPDTALMLDLGSRLNAKEAITLVTRIEREHDLTWVEAPTAPADVPGARRVSDGITGAVCIGAALNSVDDYLPWLTARAADIAQIDTARVGISGALQVSDAAFGLELPVALTRSPDNIHVHLAAALPYCASVEIAEIRESSSVRLENGWAVAS